MLVRPWRLPRHENSILQAFYHRVQFSGFAFKRRLPSNTYQPVLLNLSITGRAYHDAKDDTNRLQVGQTEVHHVNEDRSRLLSFRLNGPNLQEDIWRVRSRARRLNAVRRKVRIQLVPTEDGAFGQVFSPIAQGRLRYFVRNGQNVRLQNKRFEERDSSCRIPLRVHMKRSTTDESSFTPKSRSTRKRSQVIRARGALRTAPKARVIWKRLPLQVKSKSSLNIDIERCSSRTAWHRSAKFLPRWLPAVHATHAILWSKAASTQLKVPPFIQQFERFLPQEAISDLEVPLGQISKAWTARSVKGKSAWWGSALLLAILRSPMEALDIVHDICRRGNLHVPAEIIQDILQEVAFAQIEAVDSKEDIDSRHLSRLVDTACYFLIHYSRRDGTASLAQRTIWSLSKCCDGDQIARLLDQISSSKGHLTVDTKCHLMTALIRLNKLGLALDLLRTIPPENLKDAQVQSFCSALLRIEWEVDNLYAFRTKLMSHLLEIGLQPNAILRNIIVLNAMEAGDRKLAWETFNVTEENGLLANAYTYSILLKGIDFGDGLEVIDLIYRKAKDSGILALNPWLGAHLLYAIHLVGQRTRNRSFDAMLLLYEQLYETGPLEALGIVEESVGATQLLMKPNSHGLAWMVIAWIVDHIKYPDRIEEVYKRYLNHVCENHPRIAPLAERTFVADAFILALGQHRSTLHLGTTIIQDMVKPPRLDARNVATKVDIASFEDQSDQILPDNDPTWHSNIREGKRELSPSEIAASPITPGPPKIAAELHALSEKVISEESHNYAIAPPSVWTWNALLTSLIRHKKVDEAEKVMSLMVHSGIQPNNATWNRLISGYVKLQQAGHIIKALERMGTENLKPDEYTMDLLGQYGDRTELLAAFRIAAERQALEEDASMEGAEVERPVPSVEELDLEREAELAVLRGETATPVDWLDHERMEDTHAQLTTLE